MQPFFLNIKGKLHEYDRPTVMGILNVTPDSFFSGSRAQTIDDIKLRVRRLVDEGADFIDVGAYSTRPGAAEVSVDEELRRLETGMEALRAVAPDAVVSVDTFRAEVAKRAVLDMSADIVNDISGGDLDPDMFETVASLQVPYVLSHWHPHGHDDYDDFLPDVVTYLAERINRLNLLGVNDVIVDPGIGFGKTLDQNYILLRNLELFDVFHAPLLVGLSRKSMITQLLGVSSEEALNGTTALNMIALQRGAAILRVHDVVPARQAITLCSQL
ncbi:MAG: dihydropteroate synthase [Muribaculaceae bacterium]|nr:dihydropteroate synthase [Muribaculaceae bacterium]